MTTTQPARAPHGASCTCDACMDRDERRWTVWHEPLPTAADDDAALLPPPSRFLVVTALIMGVVCAALFALYIWVALLR